MKAGASKYAAAILAALLGMVPMSTMAVPHQGRAGSQHTSVEEKNPAPLEREIHHQLLLLPYYSVFDNLEFSVSGNKVILIGQVVRPTLKAHAEAAVKSIEGVAVVDNRIEVLPISASDDDLRTAVYRAVYEDAELKKYGVQTLPTIHIVVKNGHVSLAGSVESEADKNLAGSRTSGVANVGTVRNDLVVHGKPTAEK